MRSNGRLRKVYSRRLLICGRFIIVAHRNALLVYSTSNSLLNRSIELSIKKSKVSLVHIVDYVLSPSDPNIIWAACSDGSLYKVDWASGERSEKAWKTPSKNILRITVASLDSAEQGQDVLFTAEEHDGEWRISAHELSTLGTTTTSRSRVIYKSTQSIQIIKATDEGAIIVAASEERVLLGSLRSADFGSIDRIRYEFRVFESTDYISSLDVRVFKRSSAPIEAASRVDKVKVVDVVVGNVKGSIFVHNDLLRNLLDSERSRTDVENPINLTPRKLHWHRKAVHSVKWSLDGLFCLSRY
jgi:NET1-associated nuclear protein 1 (U3 small nucleolar RNA-associated protein 17)